MSNKASRQARREAEREAREAEQDRNWWEKVISRSKPGSAEYMTAGRAIRNAENRKAQAERDRAEAVKRNPQYGR